MKGTSLSFANNFYRVGESMMDQGGGAQPLSGQQAALNQSNAAQGEVGRMVQRAPKWDNIYIYDVRDYERNGKTMFAFNSGTLHLSYAQLYAAGIENPNILQGTNMLIDFFQIGEELLNGSIVRDANRIVRQFIPEKDKELERSVALDMKKNRAQSWSTRVMQTTGGNTGTRSTGITGVTPGANLSAANTGIPFQQGGMPLGATQQIQADLNQRDFSNSAGGANLSGGGAAVQDNSSTGGNPVANSVGQPGGSGNAD